MSSTDSVFAGSIPALYDRCLGPLLFQPYAAILADLAQRLRPTQVIETAAGTGLVTRALNIALPETDIIATDLNPAMLEIAASRLQSEHVQFQPADALDLPFTEGEFDLAVCQFGSMFYSDKVQGNREIHRVLRKGGCYLNLVWDRLSANPVSQAAEQALASVFPDDPPRFLSRTPFGYFDRDRLRSDAARAGFTKIAIETLEAQSLSVTIEEAAIGLVQGSPMRSEIEARDAGRMEDATRAVAQAIESLDYDSLDSAPMSAVLVTAVK